MNLLVSKRVRCCISILLVFGFLFLVEADDSGRIYFPDEIPSRFYETSTVRLFRTPKTTKSTRPLEGGVSKLGQHLSPTSTTTASPPTTTTALPTTESATNTESDGAQQFSSEESSSEESSSETKTATTKKTSAEGKIVQSSPSNTSDVKWHAYAVNSDREQQSSTKTLPKCVSSAGAGEEPSVVYIQKNLIVYDSDLDDARHYSVTMPKPTCQESHQSGSTNLGEDAQTEPAPKRVLHVYDSDTKSMKTIEI